MRIWMALLVVAAAAVLAGCGGSSSGGSSSDETVISTRQEQKELVLVNDADHTLYTFSGDSCEGDCANVWPPMVAKGEVEAESDSGLNADLLGKSERADGTSQVTYDGKPLYLYSKDGAGQTTGQGASFGGTWRAATATASFERQTTTGVSCEPNCDY
jgi:predicted lipoprotein with Yx(FWY)xxD motif